jgi:acyl-coenzyme A thioesterase PaaI-like protein
VTGIGDSLKREEIGFRAFFEFLAERPEFYRILNEAETFSPRAFHDHMRNMAEGYLRAMRRSRAKSELPGFEERELEVIVYAMLAARNYLSYRYLRRDGRTGLPPDWITSAYMKFITGGMLHGGTSGRNYRPRRTVRGATPSRPVAFGIVGGAPGRAVAELDVDESEADGSGGATRAALLDLLDAAGQRAAATMSESPALLSLNGVFLGAPTGPRLLAEAEAERRGEHVHVNLRVTEPRGKGEPVATAHAIYSLSRPGAVAAAGEPR